MMCTAVLFLTDLLFIRL